MIKKTGNLKTLQKKASTLKRLRIVYQITFLTIFFYLLIRTGADVPVRFFFQIDPLVALSTILSSGTLYEELTVSFIILAGTLILGRFFAAGFVQWVLLISLPAFFPDGA